MSPAKLETFLILHVLLRSSILSRLVNCEATPEAVTQRCSVKKVLLEISQNSQENSCARVFYLIKLQARPVTLLKRLWHWCFPVNFSKFQRTPFLTEHLRWLLSDITWIFVYKIKVIKKTSIWCFTIK